MNETGHDSANGEMCDGRDIPWLQDDATTAVWTSWAPTYRDLVILDRDNQKVEVFNLTDHNLGDATEYAALKALLIDVATR